MDSDEVLAKTAEDQIAVSGILESRALVSVHYRGGVSRGTRLLREIKGSEGDLKVVADGGQAQTFDLTVYGGRGRGRALEMIATPRAHCRVPEGLVGSALDVAQAWRRSAEDIRNDTGLCPDFEEAVAHHRMIAAVEEAAVVRGAPWGSKS